MSCCEAPVASLTSSGGRVVAKAAATAAAAAAAVVAADEPDYELRSVAKLHHGDHLCSLYTSDEQHHLALTDFFRAGIGNNERVAYVADEGPDALQDETLPRLEQWMGFESGKLAALQAKGQVVLVSAEDIYERSPEATKPEVMLRFLQESLQAALDAGFSGLRITGEMTWTLRHPRPSGFFDELIDYENKLNAAVLNRQLVLLCQYDQRCFAAEVLLQVLTVHPLVVIDSQLFANFYYVDAEVFLRNERNNAVLARWLLNLHDRRRVELRLREAMASLGDSVGRLCSANGELSVAQQRAEAAALAKAQFLAFMSHEIRTPMTGLLGVTDLLRETPLTAEQRELLAIMRSSGEHLLHILNAVLELSKLESHKVQLQVRPFDMCQLVRSAAGLFLASAKAKGLTVQACVVDAAASADAAALCRMHGDATRLAQVLHNLLNNAIKFTATGGITLDLSLVSLADSGLAGLPPPNAAGVVRVAVIDTGMGIPPEQIEAIFDRYHQVDKSGKSGTGLGLAICRELIQLMGGAVRVSSDYGRGSTFALLLPYSRDGDDLYLCEGSGDDAADDAAATAATAAVVAAAASASSHHQHTSSSSVPSTPDCSSTAAALPPPPPSPIAVSTSSSSSSPEAPASSSAAPARVLLAEDNAVAQAITARMLRQMGVQTVDIVDNGVAVVERAIEQHYDAVLLDMHMPQLDGAAALRLIRAATARIPGRPPTRIFAVSGDPEQPGVAVDGWLTKPVTLPRLTQLLASAS